jgi:hypothetical protein
MTLFSRASGQPECRLGPDLRLLTGLDSIIVGAYLLSLAHLNSLEVLFLMLTRFRRRSGLYFWAVAIAAISSMMFTIGVTLLELVPGRLSLLVGAVSSFVGYLSYDPQNFFSSIPDYILSPPAERRRNACSH